MSCTSEIFIRWLLPADQYRSGSFQIGKGTILSITPLVGNMTTDGPNVALGGGECILKVTFEISPEQYGPDASILKWEANEQGFSFLPVLLDINPTISIPDYRVTIGAAFDLVNSSATGGARAKDALDFHALPRGREITLHYWATQNCVAEVPTVLGLTRDQRLFLVEVNSDEPDSVQIKAGRDIGVPSIGYSLGHPAIAGARHERWLEKGHLPILHWRRMQGGLIFEETAFISFADRPLEEEQLEGTPFPISHLYSFLSTFPPGQKERVSEEARHWAPAGEVVLFLKTRVTNPTSAPLLVTQRLPLAFCTYSPSEEDLHIPTKHRLDGNVRLDEDGVVWTEGVPFSRHLVNGSAASAVQPCVLLAPGESLTIESLLSHSQKGLSAETRKRNWDWERKIVEAREFWKQKLRTATQVSIPEPQVENFSKQAGFTSTC